MKISSLQVFFYLTLSIQVESINGFSIVLAMSKVHHQTQKTNLHMTDTIISPFDDNAKGGGSNVETKTRLMDSDVILDLTWENVELVLDELRPFLIQDGGNVVIKDIDGPVVKLQLEVCSDRSMSLLFNSTIPIIPLLTR